MELVGDLGDAHRGLTQQEGGLHEKHLVDVVNDGATTRHLTDNTREVGGGDAEFGGIEADVVMLGEMFRQQAEESEEDFLDALGEAVLADAVLLDGGEVGEEEAIEHAQAVVGKRKTHLLVVNHHLHQFAQAAKIVGFKRKHGRSEFYHRKVGRADGVAYGGQREREVLVAKQADAAVVAGTGEDSDLESRRIGIEVALTKRQFAIII